VPKPPLLDLLFAHERRGGRFGGLQSVQVLEQVVELLVLASWALMFVGEPMEKYVKMMMNQWQSYAMGAFLNVDLMNGNGIALCSTFIP